MKLYFKYFKMNLKSELQYKASFIMSIITQVFVIFSYYFTVICLFEKFSNIKGFTKYEVLLTFSIIQLGFSFCESFFRGMDQFDDLIISGNFDKLLLRPRNIILQIFGEQISITRMARFLESIVILIIAVFNIDISWDILKVITLLLMILSGIIIFLSIFIITSAYCFITIKGLEIRNVFTNGGKHMAQYPIGIFKKGFLVFFTFIIPYGFVNYYPLLYLLDKSSNHFLVISPLLTIIYLIPCIFLFYKGVKKYSSAGA